MFPAAFPNSLVGSSFYFFTSGDVFFLRHPRPWISPTVFCTVIIYLSLCSASHLEDQGLCLHSVLIPHLCASIWTYTAAVDTLADTSGMSLCACCWVSRHTDVVWAVHYDVFTDPKALSIRDILLSSTCTQGAQRDTDKHHLSHRVTFGVFAYGV